MGLIAAAMGAASGVLSDQYKEFFYCEAMPENVLVTKGINKKTSKGSNKGSDNIITQGSIVAVADGQCMIIVDQGAIAEICSEPGEYTYDASTEPTIFCDNLKEGIKQSFENFAKRFTFGGEPPKDQRVYYFNLKEIIGNKYGTASPVPFRVVDERAGIDMDIGMRCFGEYSYKITDPILFYKNVCGNISGVYTRDQIDSQLKSELLTALQPAFAKISEKGVRYSALPGHTMEIADALNDVLSAKWRDQRGIEIEAFGISSITADEEDEATIKEMQKTAALRDPSLVNATLAGAQAQAMKDAANNAGGAAIGFMGMNMAMNAGGAQNYVGNAQAMQQQPPQMAAMSQTSPDSWTCECGTANSGKFCQNCGKPKPEASGAWTCSCGTENSGKFCTNCGNPRPAAVSACPNCGWKVPDPSAPPKFCPECGNKF